MIKVSKKLVYMLCIMGQFVFASNLPIKNQDVSPQQLQAQNKEITKLVAAQLSKDLPQQIDKYTKFTNIKAQDASLIYTFEINTGAKSDQAVIKDDKERMENAVMKGVCMSSKRFMDAQIVISYIYISEKTKAKLFQFNIDQKKCYKLYDMNQ